MLRASTGALVVATALLALAACKKEAAAPLPTINASMTGVMEPTAQTIWDTVSKAYNDKGDALDPTKLSEDDWKKLAEASAKMKERSLQIAGSQHVVVAADTETILGGNAAGVKGNIGPTWEAASAKQIQARIDAKPALFAQKAKDLADTAETINRAAATKDIALLYKATANVDEVCDACHEPFWGTDEPPPFPKQ